MRKQQATLAIAALLGIPFAVNAEKYMPSDDQIQPGMSERGPRGHYSSTG
jgi:hypothetical protein